MRLLAKLFGDRIHGWDILVLFSPVILSLAFLVLILLT